MGLLPAPADGQGLDAAYDLAAPVTEVFPNKLAATIERRAREREEGQYLDAFGRQHDLRELAREWSLNGQFGEGDAEKALGVDVSPWMKTTGMRSRSSGWTKNSPSRSSPSLISTIALLRGPSSNAANAAVRAAPRSVPPRPTADGLAWSTS